MKKFLYFLILFQFLFQQVFAETYQFIPNGNGEHGSYPDTSALNLKTGAIEFVYVDNANGTRTWYRAEYMGKTNEGGASFNAIQNYGDYKVDPNDKSITPPDFDPADNQTPVPTASSNPNANSSTNPNSESGSGTNNLPTGNSDIGNSLQAGLNSALIAGGAVVMYRLFVQSEAEQAEFEKIQNEIYSKTKAINDVHSLTNTEAMQAYQVLQKVFSPNASANIFDKPLSFLKFYQADSYKIQTTDIAFRSDVAQTRAALRAIVAYNPTRQDARDLGLKFTETADLTYNSNPKAANEFLNIAKGLADVAIGWDPITGPIRAAYEAFTGKNLITGETLSSFARSMAMMGVVTFGFGSEIAKGLGVISKAAEEFKDAEKIEEVIATTEKAVEGGAFKKGVDYNADVIESGKAFDFLDKISKQEPTNLVRYIDLVNKTQKIEIQVPRYGAYKQEMSKEALDLYEKISAGERDVVRVGERGVQKINLNTPKEQTPNFWSPKNSGIPAENIHDAHGVRGNLEFEEGGKVKDAAQFIVKKSAPLVENGKITRPGGALEVVVESGGVETTYIKDIGGN